MLANHRRAFWYALGFLAAVVVMFAAVGRHPPASAPLTTVPFIGEWDGAVHGWAVEAQSEPLTWLARALNVLGGGLVTIPLRLVVAAWLAFRTRWRALSAWLVTWAISELLLSAAKGYFHRGRPPGGGLPSDALVEVVGFSFPSGHAVAGASIAVALVLVLMEPGPARRHWEWGAAAFAFVMASSRVYLRAHWLSDVAAGVLLGAGVALGVAALVTEIRDRVLHAGHRTPRSELAAAPGPPSDSAGPLSGRG